MVKKSFISLAFLFSSLLLISTCEANDKKRSEKNELENPEDRKRAAIASLRKKQIEAEKKAAWERRKQELSPVAVNLLSKFDQEASANTCTHDGEEEYPKTAVFKRRTKK